MGESQESARRKASPAELRRHIPAGMCGIARAVPRLRKELRYLSGAAHAVHFGRTLVHAGGL